MPATNLIQAQFPAGSRVIPNPHGTAPGIDLEVPRAVGRAARVFALPGVPAEMKEMWAATVGPAIREHAGITRLICHYRIKCFGVGESDLEAMLPDLIARNRYPLVGITVHQATITLRITAEGKSPAAARAAMQPTIYTIRACLGDLIFGDEDDELEDAVVRLLGERCQTLAVVEWGTAGIVTQWLSECEEAKGVFAGGLVLQSLAAADAISHGISKSPCADNPASPPFMKVLALAARLQFGVDWLLAIGPIPTSAEHREVTVALASSDAVALKAVPYAGHPAILRDRTAKQALDFLRKQLLSGQNS
jgi:nicotinamide-nucleotide amidase